MKNAFLIPYDYEEQFAELSNEEVGQIIRAMFDYEKNLKKPNLTDRLLKTVWLFVEKNLDNNRREYDKRCETSAKNGQKGGRPTTKNVDNSLENDVNNLKNLKKPNDNLTEPKKPDNVYKTIDRLINNNITSACAREQIVDKLKAEPAVTFFLNSLSADLKAISNEIIESLSKAFAENQLDVSLLQNFNYERLSEICSKVKNAEINSNREGYIFTVLRDKLDQPLKVAYV